MPTGKDSKTFAPEFRESLDKSRQSPERKCVKVASKSPPSRRTLTLALPVVELMDRLRGSVSKARFVQLLIENEAAKREKDAFYARAARAYTPAVREETLALHGEYPIHEK